MDSRFKKKPHSYQTAVEADFSSQMSLCSLFAQKVFANPFSQFEYKLNALAEQYLFISPQILDSERTLAEIILVERKKFNSGHVELQATPQHFRKTIFPLNGTNIDISPVHIPSQVVLKHFNVKYISHCTFTISTCSWFIRCPVCCLVNTKEAG